MHVKNSVEQQKLPHWEDEGGVHKFAASYKVGRATNYYNNKGVFFLS